MVTDYYLKNFIVSEEGSFFSDFFSEILNVIVYLPIAFFHRFVIANDGFSDFFFEISEKSFNNGEHFALSFKNFLFYTLLLFNSHIFLLFNLLTAVA